MKRILIITFLLSLMLNAAWSQENMLTLTGGYAWASLEESDSSPTGFRINGIYEFNPNEGNFSHGLSIGYIGTKSDSAGVTGVEYKLNNWPIYYAPKVMFGNGDKFKAFVRGALGMHFSGYKRTTNLLEVSSNDSGFYGGLAAGLMIFVKENVFLNAEYEWAYLSNSFYQNGFMNTANFGIGFKF